MGINVICQKLKPYYIFNADDEGEGEKRPISGALHLEFPLILI